MPRLRGRGHERHRRRRVPRRQARHAGDLAAAHRARHVEREQHAGVGRLDVPERRVERGVERVDDRAPPGSTCACPGHRGRSAYVRSADSTAIGCTRALRSRSASPSCSTAYAGAVRAGRDHADAGQRRQVADERRHRHPLEQRRPHLRLAEVLRLDRLARQAVLADEPRRLGRGVRRLGLRRSPRRSPAGRVVSPPRDDPLEQPRVLVGDGQARVARAGLRARVGEAQEVAVAHAVALAVLDRLVRELVRRTGRRTTRRRRGAARDPSRGTARRSGRTRTGACRCGTRPAARRARACASRRRSPEAAIASAKIAGSFLAARPSRVIATISRTARGPSAAIAARDRGRVLARQRPLTRVERAALGAEDQEAAQARPVVDGPREAAGGVRHLVRCRGSARSGACAGGRSGSGS